MAFTYDPTTDRGKVRLLLGDTSSPGTFTDADIDALLELCEGDVYLAAGQGYRSLAALAAKAGGDYGVVEVRHGPRTDKFSAADLIALAEAVETKARAVPWEQIDSYDYVVDAWGRDHSEYVGDRIEY